MVNDADKRALAEDAEDLEVLEQRVRFWENRPTSYCGESPRCTSVRCGSPSGCSGR
jgi:hypothetical protein